MPRPPTDEPGGPEGGGRHLNAAQAEGTNREVIGRRLAARRQRCLAAPPLPHFCERDLQVAGVTIGAHPAGGAFRTLQVLFLEDEELVSAARRPPHADADLLAHGLPHPADPAVGEPNAVPDVPPSCHDGYRLSSLARNSLR